jgi:small conductance mechanosensitive channel
MLEFIKNDKIYLPVIYIAGGIFIYSIIIKMISSISKIDIKKSKGLDKRKNTIIALIKSIIKYLIALIVIIMVLGVYGVNTTSLIASLGIATAIIGLAFQDTIKDFLAGVFLIFDNAYAVGDTVKINGFMGEVIALGLKTTKIRSYTGEVMILSNSSFTEVINYNLNNTKVLIKVPVSYDMNMEKLEKVLNNIKTIIEEEKDVYSMDLLGIDEFGDSSINYAIMLECVPLTHHAIRRKLLGIIKREFDKNNIVIPYNQIDVHIEK